MAFDWRWMKKVKGLPIEANISQNNEAKLQEGIFVGPQIKQIFEDQAFSTKLNATERRAGEAFENISRDFLGNKKIENCSENVQELRGGSGK